MERRQHLHQNEHDADGCKRTGERFAALDRANQHTHDDGEERREYTSQQEHDPPRDRKSAAGLWQDAEEYPPWAGAQACNHGIAFSVTC